VLGGASLAPFREPNFRLLWLGQAVSAIGDSLMPVAFAFATLSVSGSATSLGLVLGAGTVARVISLPIGGVWADRLPRQLVMLSSDGVRAAINAAMGAILIAGHAQLWHLVLTSVLFNFADGFFTPAAAALMPEAVSKDRLQQANALMGLARSTTNVAGPAISGVLVAVISPGWVFAIDAGSFVVSAISLALLRIPRGERPQSTGFWKELAEGWQAVTSRRWYLLNLGSHAMWNFAIAAFFVLGPIVAKRELGGPAAWGLITASIGGGSIVGGLFALRLMTRRPLVAANLALTPSALQLLALAVPLPVAAIIVAALIGWAGLTYLNEVWSATVPHLMPADVLGRANSIDWLLSIIAMPAGFAIAGPVADHVGIPTTLVAAACLLAIPSFLVVLVPGVRNVRRTPEGAIVLENGPQSA
jgi:MFS family permease